MNNDFAGSAVYKDTVYILATSKEFMQNMRRRLPSIPLPEPVQYPVIIVAYTDTLEFQLFYQDCNSAPAASTFVVLPEEPAYVA